MTFWFTVTNMFRDNVYVMTKILSEKQMLLHREGKTQTTHDPRPRLICLSHIHVSMHNGCVTVHGIHHTSPTHSDAACTGKCSEVDRNGEVDGTQHWTVSLQRHSWPNHWMTSAQGHQ